MTGAVGDHLVPTGVSRSIVVALSSSAEAVAADLGILRES
jgi:hypothetical protein